MIEEKDDSRAEAPLDIGQNGCAAFQELMDWQVDQYRMAVDQNMWFMGERLGRAVDWEEAEEDFLQHGYYGCAPKWRDQYCRNKCAHAAACELGRSFSRNEAGLSQDP